MSDIKKNFYYTGIVHDLHKMSDIFRQEYLREAINNAMDEVFKDAYDKSDNEETQQTTTVNKRPRGRPKKNQ